MCVGGLALWCVHSINGAVGQTQQQSQKQVATQQVMIDVSRLFVGVGNFVISANRIQGSREGPCYTERISGNNRQSQKTSREGRRAAVARQIEQATAPWREADDRVMKLSLAGKRAEAAIAYGTMPCRILTVSFVPLKM